MCNALSSLYSDPQAIVPGAFYLEMVLEANRKLPVTLANIEFKSMLYVPLGSQGESPAVVCMNVDGPLDGKGTSSFRITSVPSRGPYSLDHRVELLECCTGLMLENHLLDSDGGLNSDMVLGVHGLVTPLHLQDIGREGLEKLIREHTVCYADTQERFYGAINDKVRQEGLDSYRLPIRLE